MSARLIALATAVVPPIPSPRQTMANSAIPRACMRIRAALRMALASEVMGSSRGYGGETAGRGVWLGRESARGHRLAAPAMTLVDDVYEIGVEYAFLRLRAKHLERLLVRDGRLVGPFGFRERVEDVGQHDDARLRRYFGRLQLSGVPRSVQPLVMSVRKRRHVPQVVSPRNLDEILIRFADVRLHRGALPA